MLEYDQDNDNEDDDFDLALDDDAPKEENLDKNGKRKNSPRKILYVLSAIKDGKVISQRVLCQIAMNNSGKNLMGNDFDRKEGEKEVYATFFKNNQIEAETCHGPFTIVRDPGRHKRRDTVSAKVAAKYGFSQEAPVSATYKNWRVIAAFSKNPEYAQIEYVEFIGKLEFGDKKPIRPVGGRWINRALLTNIKPFEVSSTE